jgi:hypothetical protein
MKAWWRNGQTVRVSRRWKPQTSQYRAIQVAQETLRTLQLDPVEVALAPTERNRRLYNRNW